MNKELVTIAISIIVWFVVIISLAILDKEEKYFNAINFIAAIITIVVFLLLAGFWW
jgi:hypothetical protein